MVLHISCHIILPIAISKIFQIQSTLIYIQAIQKEWDLPSDFQKYTFSEKTRIKVVEVMKDYLLMTLNLMTLNLKDHLKINIEFF